MIEFTDHGPRKDECRRIDRKDYLFSAGGHVLLVILGLITFTGGAAVMPMGDGAISVTMVTVGPEAPVMIQPSENPAVTEPGDLPRIPDVLDRIQQRMPDLREIMNAIPIPAEVSLPEEVPEEIPEEVPEELPVQPEELPVQPEEIPEVVPEEVPAETPATNPPAEVQPSASSYASVTGAGSAGAGMPGPGTYESRVFNAVRRGFRTSVEPDRSYRIVLTVNKDGTTNVEVVRTSGTSAFDRAVENALALAQIPPMPPGRSNPVVLSIEFLGPE